MNQEIDCRIIIDKDVINNVLNGQINITTSSEIIIQMGVFEISGESYCSWKLNKTIWKCRHFYRKNTIVNGREQFYHTRHTLCGGKIAHKQKGEESYDFNCYWPSRLPATWIGNLGYVRYIGKVTLKLMDDVYVHKEEIFVTMERDLNVEKHLLSESRLDVRRKFNLPKLKTGHVDMSVWLPVSGAAAGQALPVICTVTNFSKVRFGSIVFTLSRIDIYRSNQPLKLVKTVRKDVCRTAKMVDIHYGKSEYYTNLPLNEDLLPTNQFYKSKSCQITYEFWVSLQGSFPHHGRYGYPNIDTPGIPIVIGSYPLKNYCIKKISNDLLSTMYSIRPYLELEELPPDEEMERIITETDEDVNHEMLVNLQRQLPDFRRPSAFGIL